MESMFFKAIDLFGSLTLPILISLLLLVIGKYLINPLIDKYAYRYLVKRNKGKDPANGLVDVEILRKRMWAFGGILMIISFTTVTDLFTDFDIKTWFYGLSFFGVVLGYKDYKKLCLLRKTAKIYKNDTFRNIETGIKIRVTDIRGSSVIGDTERPNIKRNVFSVDDWLNGKIEDLGPYGCPVVISFLVDVHHKSYTLTKSNLWHAQIRKMLEEREDVVVVSNGKYVIPKITFLIKAKDKNLKNREAIFTDVSQEIEKILDELDTDFITPI